MNKLQHSLASLSIKQVPDRIMLFFLTLDTIHYSMHQLWSMYISLPGRRAYRETPHPLRPERTQKQAWKDLCCSHGTRGAGCHI